jgi:hypothetical protein
MTLVATDVDVDFDPPAGEPLVTFGSLGVEFDDDAGSPLAGWGGTAGNFAIDADLTPTALPGFFVDITVPDDEQFGIPTFIPLHVDEVGITFPNVDLGNIPPGGFPITDLAAFKIRFSGGIEATDEWPISASVDGLEVDLGKLMNLEFPITNLEGFKMGVEPFELVPGFVIGGGLELRTIDVDGDPAPGEQIENVFYGRVFGTFEFEGIGAGVDLVVSEYGPVLAQVTVPLGIPLDGGLVGGIILSDVTGGLKFGGPGFPDPDRPVEILHDPAFDTDFPVNDATIRASVEPAVQDKEFTWDNGFTLALSGTMIHALAPGIVTGEVTLGANIGLGTQAPGLKLIGSGDISVFGMPMAGAAMLLDLRDPIAPKWDLAFETPQPGNPLGFLTPAQTTFEVSVDTKGIVAGFALAVDSFVNDVVAGSLGVGQAFFDDALDELAAELEADHSRPLAQILVHACPPKVSMAMWITLVRPRLSRCLSVMRIVHPRSRANAKNSLPRERSGSASQASPPEESTVCRQESRGTNVRRS